MPWQVTARTKEGMIFLNNHPLRKDEAMALGRALAQAAVTVHQYQEEEKQAAERLRQAQMQQHQQVLETIPSFPSFETVMPQQAQPPAPPGEDPRNSSRAGRDPEQAGFVSFPG